MVIKRHKYSQLLSIGHPRSEDKPCAFLASIRKTGRLKELLEKGSLPIKNITPWSGGKVQYLACPSCSTMNPVSRAGLRLKCKNCGIPLLAVHVKKPNSKRRK